MHFRLHVCHRLQVCNKSWVAMLGFMWYTGEFVDVDKKNHKIR